MGNPRPVFGIEFPKTGSCFIIEEWTINIPGLY
jgi:hypothetical protein